MDACDGINRRRVLGGASSLAIAATLPFGARAYAQTIENHGPTDLERRLISLEQRASELNLPDLALPDAITTRGPPEPINEVNAYRVAMPRLVNLIDRSGFGTQSEEIAQAAGELLSKLNSEQRGHAREGWVTRGRPAQSLNSLRVEYRQMFESCHIRQEYRYRSAEYYLSFLRRYRSRYEGLANQVQIPWYFIGIIHGLEGSFNFLAHLHNGDPLARRTVNVPKNRPTVWLPPTDWETSAKDALDYDRFLGKADWSLEAMLYRWEVFNGFGYRRRAIPSPYLWSFSKHYNRGKYASDGKFNPLLKSQQCGAAVMLSELIRAKDIRL